ncbi:MAG: hypothetical protein KIG95_06415, partial [Comamonas sp.]|nr:hypothetical protein [Comamonas sp.]
GFDFRANQSQVFVPNGSIATKAHPSLFFVTTQAYLLCVRVAAAWTVHTSFAIPKNRCKACVYEGV